MIVNVTGPVLSTPPFVVPPLSCSVTEDSRRAVRVGRGGEGQHARRRHGRLHQEQRSIVVADKEGEGLAPLVRSRTDPRCPRVDRDWPHIFIARLVTARSKAGRVVDARHRDRKRLRG